MSLLLAAYDDGSDEAADPSNRRPDNTWQTPDLVFSRRDEERFERDLWHGGEFP